MGTMAVAGETAGLDELDELYILTGSESAPEDEDEEEGDGEDSEHEHEGEGEGVKPEGMPQG